MRKDSGNTVFGFVVRAAGAGLTALSVLSAQVDWYPMPDLPPRSEVSTSEDPAGTGLIRFGGTSSTGRHNDMLRWDGSGWRWLATRGAPSARSAAAMARDPLTNRVLLFGGFGYGPNGILGFLADTWEFDGTTWTQLMPATVPPPRSNAQLVWHGPSQRLVMVGGGHSNSYYADTWEWTGTDWVRRTPATSLPAMQRFRMVADPVRGRLVLHGGDTRPSTTDFGTFEWDGVDWTRMQPATPLRSVGLGMAFDARRGRVIAHSPVWPAPNSVTWEWDGIDWAASAIVPPPSGGSVEFFADPATGGLLMLDGRASPVPTTDTLLLDLRGWHLHSTLVRPPASSAIGLTYRADLEFAYLFLGNDVGVLGTSTWELSRSGWKRVVTAQQPSRRSAFAMVEDSARRRAVLFGGADSLLLISDETWSFDGQQWTLETPPVHPPATFSHTMAYDSARDRVVLFGGQSIVAPGTSFTQTWEYDGLVWIQHQPATLPPGRFGATMCYDPLRQETVLFGGTLAAGGVAADTWIWNGIDWSPRAVTSAPPARFNASSTFDAARGVVVLCGGSPGGLSQPLDDVWEWDGVAWTERIPASTRVARAQGGLCHVPWLDGCLQFGGRTVGGHAEDSGRVYRPVDPAQVESFGTACNGTLGPWSVTPVVGAWPYLGRPVTLEIAPLHPGGLAWLVFGRSDRSLGQFTLPLDLAPVGMPGCWLLTSNDATALVSVTGPSLRYALHVPLQPSLVGVDLFHQALALDPGANAAGVIASQGVRLRFGRW